MDEGRGLGAAKAGDRRATGVRGAARPSARCGLGRSSDWPVDLGFGSSGRGEAVLESWGVPPFGGVSRALRPSNCERREDTGLIEDWSVLSMEWTCGGGHWI